MLRADNPSSHPMQNAEKFRQDLINIARTTLSSKILTQDKGHFAELAVDAVLRLKGSTNLASIQIIKRTGGTLEESYLAEGFILDKKIGIGQPKRIENAKILVANTSMDTDKIKVYGARVRTESMQRVADIEMAEKDKMRSKVNKILDHGVNCFVNRQLIYNFPEELFADAGVMAIEHADFDGIERLALVTGGEITSTFDNPDNVTLGRCDVSDARSDSCHSRSLSNVSPLPLPSSPLFERPLEAFERNWWSGL